MTKTAKILLAGALAAFGLAGAPLRAQDAGPAQGDSSSQNPNGTQTLPSPPGPIGGVEQYRLGGETLGHSFLIPRLSLQEVYDSNPGYTSSTGASEADAVTSITAGLSLQFQKRNSTLSLDYAAGGLIYDMGTQPNRVTQTLGLNQSVTLRRWNLFWGENFSYLPNSAFGLGGLGLGSSTGGIPGLGGTTAFNPNFQQGGTIGTGNVYQLTSTTAVQAQYSLDARSSISFAGSVGFLHYFGDDLINSRDVIARATYDRSLTARDGVNISYTASILSYPSGAPGFYAQYVQVGYRRILTGRLHFSVSAGPVISTFSTQPGQTTVSGGSTTVDWSVVTSLAYALRRGSLNVQYTRGVSGGSGVLQGALTDTLSGSITHGLGRVWSGSVNGNYSHNEAFQQTTTGIAGSPTANFNYWSVGASLSRPVWRHSTFAFTYNAQRQTSNATGCVPGAPCAPIALTQVVGATFTFSTRPYRLD